MLAKAAISIALLSISGNEIALPEPNADEIGDSLMAKFKDTKQSETMNKFKDTK